MQVVNAGRTVRYEISGSGHRPVVLLPALGTSMVMWAPQIEYLSAYTVIPCETAGHFLTRTGDRSLEDYADDVRAVLDAVGLQSAHVIGISMGGMVAQELALGYPDRVSSLVLVSTTSEYPDANRAALRERASTAESQGMQALVEAILGRWFTEGFAREGPDVVEAIRQDLLSADPQAYAQAARAVAQVDTTRRLGEIDVPTLVIAGDQDTSMPAGAADLLAAGIPLARAMTIERAAHLCTVQQSEEVNRVIGTFLESVSDPQADEDTATMSPW